MLENIADISSDSLNVSTIVSPAIAIFDINNPVYHLRSAARSDLVEPRYRLERYGRRGFSVAGSHLWNLLPPDIRNFETGLDTFKKRLKTFLMQR